ncbi:hypothetical protein FGB62_20g24 [Gracilaria domingensis]|nr:hypothetical protein FGB62_20g24 [Gracilaria domingensis]
MPDRRNAGDVGNDEEHELESEHGNHDDSEENNSSDAHEMEQVQEASDGDSSASSQCMHPAGPGIVGKKVPRRVSITRVQISSGKAGSNSCARKADRVNEILHSSGVGDLNDEKHSPEVQLRFHYKVSQKNPRKPLKRWFLFRISRSDNGADIQGHGKLPQRRAGILSESHKRHQKNSNNSNRTNSRNLSQE